VLYRYNLALTVLYVPYSLDSGWRDEMCGQRDREKREWGGRGERGTGRAPAEMREMPSIRRTW
jgi:hypothetical protein